MRIIQFKTSDTCLLYKLVLIQPRKFVKKIRQHRNRRSAIGSVLFGFVCLGVFFLFYAHRLVIASEQ